MSDTLNIAVIGGGLIGLSVADSLIHRGAAVTIFEKQSEIGNGAGRYNSGMIHPSQAAPWLMEEVDLNMIRTLVRWANNSRDLLMKRRQMLSCEDQVRASGTIQLFDSHYKGLEAKAYYRDIGIECREYRGDWGFGRYVLEFPEDQSGNAYLYCQKLAADLVERGCVIKTGAPAQLVRQGKTLYVKAGTQSLIFDRVVVAAGAASTNIVKPLGYELPISAVQGHALVFSRPKYALPNIPIMHWASRSALTVFEDHVRLSGTINEEDPRALIEIWEEIAPDIVKALGIPLVEWSADRPVSQIGRPIIGATSIPHLWVNSGHGHMGWSLCTWSGEMLARMMLGDLTTPIPSLSS